MNKTRFSMACAALCAIVLVASAPANAQEAGQVVDMPSADRALIDKFLGKGVLGPAVAAEPIENPLDYVQFDEGGNYGGHITTGEHKGKVIDHSFTTVTGESGTVWEVRVGESDILNLTLNDKGDLVFLNHAEPDEGLNGHYEPPPPLLVKGMKPGTSLNHAFDLSVRYMDNPEKEKHRGRLTLTLSFLGAFEMNLPFGKHNAIAIKSEYKGKVGPAKLDDVQYRFFVKDLGAVAMIEDKDISAYLVYSNQEKVGKVLKALP